MFPKKPFQTSYSFHTHKNNQHQPTIKGQPYTQYPVPLQTLQPRQHKQNDDDEYEYPSNRNYDKNFKLMSADCKYRNNPGLMNIGRKVNFNGYDEQKLYGEAEAIRRHGMDYRRKLQQRFNSSKLNVYNSRVVQSKNKNRTNFEKQMKNWYQSRNENLQEYHLEYLKKLQTKLSNQQTDKSNIDQITQIFSQANKQWQEEIVGNLKKCFQA